MFVTQRRHHRPARCGSASTRPSPSMVGLRALARGPGAGRPRRHRARHGQARGGRPGGQLPRPAGARRGRRQRGRRGQACSPTPGRPSRTTGGCTCATSCPAATRPPSATSTRCGSSAWTAAGTSRGGATAPQDTRMFRMDRDRGARPCSTSTAPRRHRRAQRDLSEGTFRPRARRPRRHRAAAARGHLGRRLLPGGVGGAGAGGRGRRPGRADAHRRHRVAAPPGVAPRGSRRGARPARGGRRGSRGRRRRRSRPTPTPPDEG